MKNQDLGSDLNFECAKDDLGKPNGIFLKPVLVVSIQ